MIISFDRVDGGRRHSEVVDDLSLWQCVLQAGLHCNGCVYEHHGRIFRVDY